MIRIFQCLVGYTPFYADEPVMTCRKILRWQQHLDIPAEVSGPSHLSSWF